MALPFFTKTKLKIKNDSHDTGYSLFENGDTTTARTVTIPNFATQTLATVNNAQTFTGIQTFTSAPIFSSGATFVGTKNVTVTSGATGADKTWTVPNTTATSVSFAQITEAQTFAGIQTFSSMPVFSAGIQTEDIVAENTANAGLTLRVSATGTVGARIIYFGTAGAMGQVSQATNAWTFQGTTTHKAGISIDATTATNNYLQFATGGTAATGAITYTTTTGMNFNNGGLVVADSGVCSFP